MIQEEEEKRKNGRGKKKERKKVDVKAPWRRRQGGIKKNA